LSRPLPHNKKGEAPVALLRDTILSVLASAPPEPLFAADGKQKLKADVLKALQERVPDLGIENVYFTEFLVQM
jgi:flagellar basal body-associated protein FliL